MKRSVEISWADFKRCATERLEEKYPELKGAKLLFVYNYAYEGIGYYEDLVSGNPDAVTFSIADDNK